MNRFLFPLLIALSMAIALPVNAQGNSKVPVRVAEVKKMKIGLPITLLGTVEPLQRSIVASEVEGYVTSFPGREGKLVKKGDTLAKLNTKPLALDVLQIKASRREAQARLENAVREYNRFKRLLKKGVSSEDDFDRARTDKKAWTAKLAQLQAQLEKIKYDLEKSDITAPFTGYVVKIHSEQGQWMEKGGKVLELINLESVDVVVEMPERYVDKLRLQADVTLRFDALANRSFPGKISAIIPQASSSSRTFPVKIRLKNQKYLFKSGMVARVSFNIGRPTPSKVIPKDAVVSRGPMTFVFTVDDEGKVQRQVVQTGSFYKNLVVIRSKDLKPGDRVVTRGNERLRPGQTVQVVKPNKGDQ